MSGVTRRWRAPIILGCMAWAVCELGYLSNTSIALGAVRIASFEKEGCPPIAALLAEMRRFTEQDESFQRTLVDFPLPEIAITAAKTHEVDPRACQEYYGILSSFLMAGLIWFLVANAGFLWRTAVEIRKRQLLDRPAGSRYSSWAEWWLYAAQFDDYDGEANPAEWLRERYAEEWEPEMGHFLANCKYVYAVVGLLPRLWWDTGRRAWRLIHMKA